MDAPKPGSTLPPQGGKGGVQQPVPPQGGKGGARPTTNSPLQPGATIFNGVVTPNTIGPNGQPVGGTMPGGKAPGAVQPGQPQSPYTPIGAQGGKGRDFGPNVFPGPQPQVLPPQGGFPQQPIGPGSAGPGAPPPSYIADKYAEMERMRAGQVPGQIPAQGGKAPLTPEQQAAFAPYINPARPMPQVQQPAPVMPRPVSQVMPRQPTPKPAPQGLAQIQQMLRGRR